jgi:hypothetical protein
MFPSEWGFESPVTSRSGCSPRSPFQSVTGISLFGGDKSPFKCWGSPAKVESMSQLPSQFSPNFEEHIEKPNDIPRTDHKRNRKQFHVDDEMDKSKPQQTNSSRLSKRARSICSFLSDKDDKHSSCEKRGEGVRSDSYKPPANSIVSTASAPRWCKIGMRVRHVCSGFEGTVVGHTMAWTKVIFDCDNDAAKLSNSTGARLTRVSPVSNIHCCDLESCHGRDTEVTKLRAPGKKNLKVPDVPLKPSTFRGTPKQDRPRRTHLIDSSLEKKNASPTTKLNFPWSTPVKIRSGKTKVLTKEEKLPCRSPSAAVLAAVSGVSPSTNECRKCFDLNSGGSTVDNMFCSTNCFNDRKSGILCAPTALSDLGQYFEWSACFLKCFRH